MSKKEFDERIFKLKQAIADYYIVNYDLSETDNAQSLYLELDTVDSGTIEDHNLEHFETTYEEEL